MSDWILGNSITAPNKPIEVWTKSGQVRRAIFRPDASGHPWFTDCTHPAQNMICDKDSIQAWRVASITGE